MLRTLKIVVTHVWKIEGGDVALQLFRAPHDARPAPF